MFVWFPSPKLQYNPNTMKYGRGRCADLADDLLEVGTVQASEWFSVGREGLSRSHDGPRLVGRPPRHIEGVCRSHDHRHRLIAVMLIIIDI